MNYSENMNKNKINITNECCICYDIICISENNLDLMNLLNINFTQIYPICENCFNSDSYIDLIKLIEQYTNDYINFTKMKIFLFDEKFYVIDYEWKEYYKNNAKQINKSMRKNQICDIQKKYKFEQLSNLCDAYIKFGNIHIDDVIADLSKKQEKSQDNMNELVKFIKKNNFEYDSKLPSFQNYLKYGGDLKKTLEDAKLEKIFMYETDFFRYLKHNDIEVAKYLASIEFVNNGKNNEIVDKYIAKKLKINL
jgi:hypothetical protein